MPLAIIQMKPSQLLNKLCEQFHNVSEKSQEALENRMLKKLKKLSFLCGRLVPTLTPFPSLSKYFFLITT